jgi:hypothetical protein
MYHKVYIYVTMTHNIAIYIVVYIGTIVEGDGAMDLTRGYCTRVQKNIGRTYRIILFFWKSLLIIR